MQQDRRQTNASAQAHWWTRLMPLTLVTASVILGTQWLAAQAQLSPGDILVVDQQAGTGGLGMLFRVDPGSGQRTPLSDFGNAAQGDVGRAPFDVVVESAGTILISDRDAGPGQQGRLVRVDPGSGERTTLSDFGNAAQGDVGGNPAGIALEASGTILVSDQGVGPGSLGRLVRVDPGSGERTTLSNFGDPAQGDVGHHPFGVAVEASGTILVVTQQGGTNEQGALFRVDPGSGHRTRLSDFGQGANQGRDPWGVALEASGTILVMDYNAFGVNPLFNGEGVLFRVDPGSGARTRLSDFGCSAGCSTTPPPRPRWTRPPGN